MIFIPITPHRYGLFIFINSTQGVVGVLNSVPPGENAALANDTLPGARCFLEVNAGEAEGIVVGENVAITGYTQPAQLDISSLVSLMFLGMVTVMVGKLATGMLESSNENTKIIEES